ncbi:MAG TPA: serine hydrolase [Thermogutta sp.]|nr:serine hydrolase [Thermogutta sp.]
MRLFLMALIFGTGAVMCNLSFGQVIFPGERWEEVSPASVGLDKGRLDEAAMILSTKVGRDGAKRLVIVRHGRIVWKGSEADERQGVWSMTKSFTSTVAGLLIAKGRCTLDTKVADVLPELKTAYPEVRLRHLLTMTSGYRAMGDEPRGDYLHGPSVTPFVPNPEPLFTPPGTQYAYWDSAMNLLGLVLTKLAGAPLKEVFRRLVAEQIGMSNWDWGDFGEIDGIVVNGGAGNMNRHVKISACDMARFGWLMLNRGRWRDKQIVPEWWIQEATRVQVPATLPWAQPQSQIDGRGVYGFNWWVNGVGANGERALPAAPVGTFWASGHNNNRCFVIPEWDMVIVRLGLDGRAPAESWNEFLAKIGEAIRE